MRIHSVSYYDEPDQHELVDVDYQCSYSCMAATLVMCDVTISDSDESVGGANTDDGGSISWGAYPCGEETNSDVYCSNCKILLWKGLESK